MIRHQADFDQLLDALTRFVNERLIPAEQQVEESDSIPEDIVDDMKAMGLFGLSIPEQYGGLGLSMEEEVLVSFSIGHTSPAMRSMIGTNNGIGSQGLIIDGTEQQKTKYLPALASGELIGSFALTEADVGSDAGSVKTTAIRDGDHYLVNGSKRFITNAPHAGVFTLMARTSPDIKGGAGVSAFVVDADTPGISLGKPEKKMGQRGAHVCDVIFDNCRIPASSLIGGVEGQGFKTAMKVLDRGRLNIAAACVGVAERALQEALTYACQRKQFGVPIAQHQLIQAMLAESKAEIFAARSMVLEAARNYDDNGVADSTLVSCCKLFASEMVGRVADRAVQIHGGSGYIRDYPVERLYRDVRLYRLYEGTSEIQKLVIAKQMIKEATA